MGKRDSLLLPRGGGIPFLWSKCGEHPGKKRGLEGPGTIVHCLGATPGLVKWWAISARKSSFCVPSLLILLLFMFIPHGCFRYIFLISVPNLSLLSFSTEGSRSAGPKPWQLLTFKNLNLPCTTKTACKNVKQIHASQETSQFWWITPSDWIPHLYQMKM